MRRIGTQFCILVIVMMALASARPASADAVTDWNAIMQATVSAPPTNPFFQARWAAITQLAIFEAVNATTGGYEPYLGTIVAPPGASPEAAAVAAAHRTLVTLRPASAAQGKTLCENARLFALLAMAICDGSIATFDTKYFYNYWRPVTAIQFGDLDGNDKTDPDAAWLPLIATPAFPSYPSAHATLS